MAYSGESTYGSAATVDTSVGLVQSINPTEVNNLMKFRTLGGTRDYTAIVPGKFECNGSFEYLLQDGKFLRQVFGEDTGTGAVVDSGPRTFATTTYFHCMGSAASPTTDSFPSFTMEFADDEGLTKGTYNLHRTFTGCRVNTMGLSATVDDAVKVSVDYIGQGVTVSTAAATAVAESTKDPYVFYQGGIYSTSGAITGVTAQVSANQIAEVNNFNFNVNNNLEAIWYVSGTTNAYQTTRGLKKLIVKGRDYDASLGLHFKDKEMYSRFLGSNTATTAQTTLNKYQIALDFVRKGTIGTPLEDDDYLRIVLGSCAFNNINISGSPEDVVSQNIDVFVEKAKFYAVDEYQTYA